MRPTREMRPRPFLSLGLGSAISNSGGVASTSSNTLALGDVVVGNAAGSNMHFVSVSSNSGFWFPHDGDPELKWGGGFPRTKPHGLMGATETVNAADGNHHVGTLDQNCTVTVAAFADGSITFVVTNAGSFAITWSGADFGGADDQPEASSVTVYTFLSSGGTVYGFKAGGAGGSETTAETITAMGARGELLLKDGHSTPPIFDDILVNDDLTDFLYADLVDP